MKHDLPQIRGQYRFNAPLAQLTWFKVGGNAEVLFKPEDEEDLLFFLANIEASLAVYPIGAGSNIIIRDDGVAGVIVKLGRNFTNIEILEPGILKIGAAALNYNIAHFCLEHNIGGLEYLLGIPGTIGGGIATNAGAYGKELRDILIAANFATRSGLVKKKNSELRLAYRKNFDWQPDHICTELLLQYDIVDNNPLLIKERMQKIAEARSSTQPVKEKTGGSTFANPPDLKAWQLIDAVGLRGAKIGDAQFSELHCNFMINTHKATASDLENLGELAKARVLERFGVILDWEIRIIGGKR